MAPAFSPGRTGTWQEIGERLGWLLPPDQLREAEQATPNAFYTPHGLAGACWEILRGLGFDRGRVLEPGCGSGTFMAAAPAGLPITWTGVERDPVTARIAQLLHPSAQIINQPIQNAMLPAHSVDAVIGNVPFADVAVYDPTAPKEVARSLHNYCIWRSVRTLRPGGVAILITSRYTMDARDTRAREAIAAEADLIGALRLPSDALSPGGTEVVADILVLRRRDASSPPADADWIETVPLLDAVPGPMWHYDDHINQWFAAHPATVLGDIRPDHAVQYGRTVRVDQPADAAPVEAAVTQAGHRLVAHAQARGLTWDPDAASVPEAGSVGLPQRADGRKERSFHLIEGSVCQVQDGELVPSGHPGKEQRELTALIRLREAAVSLLDAEADHSRSEESLAPARATLNATYDRYIAAYGPLNRASISRGEPDPETGLGTMTRRRPRMGGFRQDPDYVTVLALESYDDETGQTAKTPIFSQRVNQRPQRPTRADSPDEAIRICLDTYGRLDLDAIAGLLEIPVGEVPGQILGLAYPDPASGGWATAEDYLSGNVRDKLEAARAAAAASGGEDSCQAAAVTALEKVQPADLGPDEIRAKPGAPWIPPADVAAFAAETFGYAPAVTYFPVTAQWEIKPERGVADTVAASEEWGTGRIDAYRLLELAVNGKAPVVYDTVTTPTGEVRVRNQPETMLAEEKQKALAARFAEWVWEDPERCDRLCADYNRRFNSVVLRRYDGSHLTFPGMAEEFTPYPHQRDMVHRIVSTPASLCPYPVGTGKTPTMFMAARKLRELGLARKPLIIVPNHLLEQTAREGKRLFPSAHILMAAREDLASAQARKLFAARCATGDWDAVVMTHSAFTAIPVHPVTQANHLTGLAARYRLAVTSGPSGGSRTVKQLAKMIDAFETRARTLLDHRTDDGIFFEHLGVDFLMVDESHYFKNLGIPVRTDGFAVPASKRATDLDMKMAQLRGRGGKVAAFFTGTPVSNSLLEMYVLQHYLHPQRLEEAGLPSADAWAATFVEFQTSVEVSPDGASFRMKRRPAKFENVPELLTLFGEAADLRPPDSFAVSRPGARHHTAVISSSPELRAYVASLAERADRLQQVDACEDNMLKICSDGRKAALDLELVGITPAHPGKIGAVVANVARIYHASREGFQIVFCDLGTPNPETGPQVYGKIRAGLIEAGVPAGQIRFIHDANSDIQKAALFTECRSGKVAVLLGSTDKLGVGTNIQTRCVAVHHVDAPWRPADVEQREGRALRPGNLNPWVDIFRYVSEKSFDSFMWQTLERKARFIGQVLGGRPAGRDVDDIGDATLSYAEVKALATGNPLLLELAEANAEVLRLRHLATAHVRATRRLSGSISKWEQQIPGKSRLADACARIAATARDHPDPAWRDHLGSPIPEPEVAQHLAHLARDAMASTGPLEAASWQGLGVTFSARRGWRQIIPVARVSAGARYLTVELNPAWTTKGQHWRIEKQIRSDVGDAAAASVRLRGEIDDLRKRIADASRRLDEPFPQAAELEAARTRRDAIEQAIRDAAAPQEDQADATSGLEPSIDADDTYQVTFLPAAISPGVSGGQDPDAPDEPTAPGLISADAVEQLPGIDPTGYPDGTQVAAPEPLPGLELTDQAVGQADSGALSPLPQASPPPRAGRPVLLARLDWEAEPLFSLPEETPPTVSHRRARPKGTRNRVAQLAGRDVAQAALFDLPPTAERGSASAPARRRPRRTQK
jgi:N12 class adenine-specific DNA methylase